MIARWRRLVERLDTREPVQGMAVFRAAVGAIVAFTLFDMAARGALTVLWLPPEAGGMTPLRTDQWLVAVLGGPSAGLTWTLVTAALAGAIAVVLGAGTRVAALITGQALLALFSLQPGTGGGHDRLITNALWLLVLAPSDRSWSLACRWRTGGWVDDTPAVAWPRWLAVWQLTVTYTITGWQKLGDEWWPWGGLDAVYRSLLQPAWARFDLAWIAWVFPATQAMTAITLWWECTFGLVVIWLLTRHARWGRWPVRAVYLGTGLAVHATLWAAMNLGPFPFITLAYYACFFGPDDVARFRAQSSRAASRSSSSTASTTVSVIGSDRRST